MQNYHNADFMTVTNLEGVQWTPIRKKCQISCTKELHRNQGTQTHTVNQRFEHLTIEPKDKWFPENQYWMHKRVNINQKTSLLQEIQSKHNC